MCVCVCVITVMCLIMQGGKFDFVTLGLKIGSMLALLAIVSSS